jgi:hypothetical protein
VPCAHPRGPARARCNVGRACLCSVSCISCTADTHALAAAALVASGRHHLSPAPEAPPWATRPGQERGSHCTRTPPEHDLQTPPVRREAGLNGCTEWPRRAAHCTPPHARRQMTRSRRASPPRPPPVAPTMCAHRPPCLVASFRVLHRCQASAAAISTSTATNPASVAVQDGYERPHLLLTALIAGQPSCGPPPRPARYRECDQTVPFVSSSFATLTLPPSPASATCQNYRRSFISACMQVQPFGPVAFALFDRLFLSLRRTIDIGLASSFCTASFVTWEEDMQD